MIRGYVYNGATHCVRCTVDRFKLHDDAHTDEDTDENGVSDTAIDDNGDDLSPVRSLVHACRKCGTSRRTAP